MKMTLFIVLSLVFALLPASAQGQERPREKAFKGMELYSWQDPNGDWLFALVPGTNRLKTEREVKKKENQIVGLKELEKHLMRLAEGEQVFWFHRDLKGFAYPDEKMLKDIAASARKAEVDLHLPARVEKNG